ncbi:MAG: recombinase family protein [Rhodospirillaceae bacterium]|nr:recombinase family protein [Rhodospirillaceae bacterium]
MSSETKKVIKCAIYTRKSTEEGLDQQFNTLDAQREACEAFILSQKHEGWVALPTAYDDGGFSGGNMDRPGLVQLMADIRDHKVDVVVVYKVDRLTRSLSDFAKIVETFDGQGVSFVSVTQQFNTTNSMGRLTLNVLLSFAQFEREVSAERVRDKIAASRKKGMWMGGSVALGYDVKDKRYVINPEEAKTVLTIFDLYLQLRSVRALQTELKLRGLRTKPRTIQGKQAGEVIFTRGHIYYILNNRSYLGEAVHKGKSYPAAHEPIISQNQWSQVQKVLAENEVNKEMGRYAKEPSLLGGIIYDDHGNRLTATHSVKRGVRYRYYIAQPLLQNQPDKVGVIKRLPAAEIEGLVSAQIRQLLENPKRLFAELETQDTSAGEKTSIVTAAKELHAKWASMSKSDTHEFIRQLVVQVIVGGDKVKLNLNRARLRTALKLSTLIDTDQDQSIEIKVNAALKRNGRETRLLIGEFSYDPRPAKPNHAMVETLKRAHKWNAEFMAGRSTADMGAEAKVDRKFIQSVIPIAFLAPDITTAILEGRQPPSLTVKQLRKHVPADWAQQRKVFGFPAI